AIDIGAYETLYYTITTEVIDETGGTIDPDQTTYVLPDEDIQFTLTPEGDNEVVSFTINENDYIDQLTEEGNSFVYTMTVTEELHAVAEFGVPSFLPGVEEQDVVVYPNPADRQLFIEGVTIDRLKIYSLNGKTIMNLQSPSSGIDVSNLKQGIYFIEIEDENQKKHITKFIKK
ncbi:MAG: T9SS type A sorting domain-containing protein, partial [Marinilabiliaceae bacterium]